MDGILPKEKTTVRMQIQPASNLVKEKKYQKYRLYLGVDINEGNLMMLWCPLEGFKIILLKASWKPVKFVDKKDRRRKSIMQTCQKGFGHIAWLSQ